MHTPDYSISTPENVDLHLELAGIGNRILANLIDFTVAALAMSFIFITGVVIYTIIGYAGLGDETQNIIRMALASIGIFILFAITFCYHIVFEGIWQGQTPGKRVAQIRVIETNGQPVGWSAVFIRNIVRVLDTWICLIGLLFMLVNKSEKRIGDLAAGTLVIRERKSELSTQDIKLISGAESDSLLDIGRVTPQEYDLLAKFLKRREKMVDSHRPQVAKRLEDYFRNKLDEAKGEVPQISSQAPAGVLKMSPAGFQSEAFLEKVFVSYQARAQE